MLYYIEAVGLDHIKIGYTAGESIVTRLAMLQTGNSHHLRLLGSIVGSKSNEMRLHTRFRKFNVRGEWFKSNPELLEHIRTSTTQFAMVERIDKLMPGGKFTRHSIEKVEHDSFFNWRTTIDAVALRLRRGEKVEQIAEDCRLDTNADQYFGYLELESKKRDRRHLYSLFLRNPFLCRAGGHFNSLVLPIPRKTIPSDPPGLQTVCYRLWERAMAEWFSPEKRLHL